MKKNIYITPKIVTYEVENVLFQSFSVRRMNNEKKEEIVDGGPVVEGEDPDGNTDGKWFDNPGNWGGY